MYSREEKKKEMSWCLKCGKEATHFCSTLPGHSTYLMESSTANLCIDLQKSKKKNEMQLSTIIKKRKEAKICFQQLTHALQSYNETIKNLESQNDSHLDEMVALSKSFESYSTVNETVTSLAQKVMQSSGILKQESQDLKRLETTLLDDIQFSNISVQVDDETLSADIQLMSIEERSKKLGIISRILLSTFTKESSPKTPKISRLMDNESSSLIEGGVFIMTIYQESSPIGIIQVKPHEKFFQPFVEGFAQFCKSPRPFLGHIVEVY